MPLTPLPTDLAPWDADPRRGAMHPAGYWKEFWITEMTIDVSTIQVPKVQYVDGNFNVYATQPDPVSTGIYTVPYRVMGGPTEAATPVTPGGGGVFGRFTQSVATDNTVLFGVRRKNPLGYSITFADIDGTLYPGTGHYTIGMAFADGFGEMGIVSPACVIPPVNEPLPDLVLLRLVGVRLLTTGVHFQGYVLGGQAYGGGSDSGGGGKQVQYVYEEIPWATKVTYSNTRVLTKVPPLGVNEFGPNYGAYDSGDWTEDGKPYYLAAGVGTAGTTQERYTLRQTQLVNTPRSLWPSSTSVLGKRPWSIYVNDSSAGPLQRCIHCLPYDGTSDTQSGPPTAPVAKPGFFSYVNNAGLRRFFKYQPAGDFVTTRRTVMPERKIRAAVYSQDTTPPTFLGNVDLDRMPYSFNHVLVSGGFEAEYLRQFYWWTGEAGGRRVNLLTCDALCASVSAAPPGPSPQGTAAVYLPCALAPIPRDYGPSLSGYYPFYAWIGGRLSPAGQSLGTVNARFVEAKTVDRFDFLNSAVPGDSGLTSRFIRFTELEDFAAAPWEGRPAIAAGRPFIAGRLCPCLTSYQFGQFAGPKGAPYSGISYNWPVLNYTPGPTVARMILPSDVAGRTIRLKAVRNTSGLTLGEVTTTTDAAGWWDINLGTYGVLNIRYEISTDLLAGESGATAVVDFGSGTSTYSGSSADNIFLQFTG